MSKWALHRRRSVKRACLLRLLTSLLFLLFPVVGFPADTEVNDGLAEDTTATELARLLMKTTTTFLITIHLGTSRPRYAEPHVV